MKLKKSLCSVLLSAAMVVTSLAGMGMSQKAEVKAADDTSVFDDLNQTEITADMGAGWNLGNQLEASAYGTPAENAWNNGIITESLIRKVKAAGFTTIRIPVSYLSKIGTAPDYTVDSNWLDRIQEVVDMCIDNGLFAIINMHGDGYTTVDGGWLLCAEENQEPIRAKYKAVWKQISARFKDYDEHLIFESMNEEFNGTWDTPNRTFYSNVNTYNQIFLDTVRQTGGNNDKRWLLIPGWNTDITYTVGDFGFVMPTDTYCTAPGKRVMMSVHCYDPWQFCGEESGQATQWGAAATDQNKVANWGDEKNLETKFDQCYKMFVENGYPVVIGEYGSIDKSSMDPENIKSREYYAKTLCSYAKERGMIPVYWDNGFNGMYGFGLFDRNKCTVTQQSIIDAIMSVYPKSSETPDIEPSIPSEVPAVEGMTYEYSIKSDWGSGFIAELVIKNTSKKTLPDWSLSFDYNSEISSMWGAEFVGQTGKTATVKCSSWATTMKPGDTITIGFIVDGTDKTEPGNFVMNHK